MAHTTTLTTSPCPTDRSGPLRDAGRPTATVGEVMLRAPKLWDSATTVADARRAFADDHLHALLIVERHVLLAVLERTDLESLRPASHTGDLAALEPTAPALFVGHLQGRLVDPAADADTTRLQMHASLRRRLAVVNQTGALLGLLCLKRSGLGFCSDANVADRADARSLPSRTARSRAQHVH